MQVIMLKEILPGSNRAQPILMTTPKITFQEVNSSYCNQSMERICLRADSWGENGNQEFTLFCNDLEAKAQAIKAAVEANSNPMSDWQPAVREYRDTPNLMVKVKAPYIREQLAKNKEAGSAKFILKLNCVWMTHEKQGLSIDVVDVRFD
mmetsp:Transcript_870/g.1115  ORF Transcript_870/g.1115 Transcript_870/m.1115 type:complete len:150 (+) Transcript_870:43-492(+)